MEWHPTRVAGAPWAKALASAVRCSGDLVPAHGELRRRAGRKAAILTLTFWRWRPETQAQSTLRGTQEPDKVGAARETEENFTFNLTNTVYTLDILQTFALL